jgi:hypothetical protein
MFGFRSRLDLARFVGLSADDVRSLVNDATTALIVGREPLREGWPGLVRLLGGSEGLSRNEKTGERSPAYSFTMVQWNGQDCWGRWRLYDVDQYEIRPPMANETRQKSAFVFVRDRTLLGAPRVHAIARLGIDEAGRCVQAGSASARTATIRSRLRSLYYACRRRLLGIRPTVVDDSEYWKTGRRGVSRDVPS